MKTHPRKELLKAGDKVLEVWHFPSRVQVRLSSVSSKHFDQMRLVFTAANDFKDHLTMSDYHGCLIDLHCLPKLIEAAGIEGLSITLPALPPVCAGKEKHISAGTYPSVVPPQKYSAKNLRPIQVKKMYALMSQGHSQAYAASMSGISETVASQLRRGKLTNKVAPEIQRAMNETFNFSQELQGIRKKTSSYELDERNAGLIPRLHQLTCIQDMSTRAAAKQMGISPSLAHKLTRPDRWKAGPKTRHAWQTHFGNF